MIEAAGVLARIATVPAVIRADVPDGLPTADPWSFLHTVGIFVGLPALAGAVITGLVLLQSAIKKNAAAGGSAVFAGPHAGDVAAGAYAGGTGPVTETGEDSGMHREVAQPSTDSGADTPMSDHGAEDALAADHRYAETGELDEDDSDSSGQRGGSGREGGSHQQDGSDQRVDDADADDRQVPVRGSGSGGSARW